MACHAGFSCSDEPDFAVTTHPRSIASRGDNAAPPCSDDNNKGRPCAPFVFQLDRYAAGLLGTAWDSTPHGASPMPDPIDLRELFASAAPY
jgi:hypothetical protein